MTNRSLFSAIIVSGVTILLACSSNDETRSRPTNPPDYRKTALEFVTALAERDYPKAYAMTAQNYRTRTTVENLRIAFETIVPTDWGPMGPVEVGQTMEVWPGKLPSDVGWAYVSIGGDVYSEAVTVVVTAENGEAKIREVEFGRP